MGDWRKVFAVTIISVILLTGLVGLSEEAFADKKTTTKIIHLGYLQLAAHDFFDMNRSIPFDNENGKLDLSTVLFNPQAGQCNFKKSLNEKGDCILYEDDAIANGGEIRSVENIMISTAGAEVGEKYLKFVENHGEEKAYQKTIKFYHKQIKKAYEDSFNLKFPKPQDGVVDNLHNLALRAGHDFLPAEIMFNGELTSIFDINPLGEKLSEQEKVQQSSPVDGLFDEEFLEIEFCPAPGFCIIVNLLDADRSFGTHFGFDDGTDPLRFDDFMEELEDGKFDTTDEVSILLEEAFSRGINLD